MVMRMLTMRCCRTRSRTITDASRFGSMLPPESTSPTRAPAITCGIREHGRERRGAGAFRDGLLDVEVQRHRALDLGILDDFDRVHEPCATTRRVSLPAVLDRDALGDRAALPAIERPCRAARIDG